MNEARNKILEENHIMAFEHGKYVSQLKKEKQDLIKYLEDKIKQYDNQIKMLYLAQANNPNVAQDIHESQLEKVIYQEILGKIKGGNYE